MQLGEIIPWELLLHGCAFFTFYPTFVGTIVDRQKGKDKRTQGPLPHLFPRGWGSRGRTRGWWDEEKTTTRMNRQNKTHIRYIWLN